MIDDILSIAHDISGLVNEVAGSGSNVSKVANAIYQTDKVRSIAEKARKSIMMYKVLLSCGIRDSEIAFKITKYLENMYSVFTLLVLGYSPTTSGADNSGLNSIISNVSAESFKQLTTDHVRAVESALSRDMMVITTSVESKGSGPRIGKNASAEAMSQNDKDMLLFDTGFNVGHKAGYKEGSGEKNYYDAKTNLANAQAQYNTDKNEREKERHELEMAEKNAALEKAKNMRDEVKFAEIVSRNKNEPTILNIKVKTATGSDISVPIAIKANMYPIGTEELRLIIESGIGGKASSFLRKIKWRSGEISTLAWIFGTDLAKRDKELYKKLGRNPWYIELQKRKLSSKAGWWSRFIANLRGGSDKKSDMAFEISGYRGDIPPTASLIVTKDDLVAATRLSEDHFDKNEGFIANFMKDSFLLCFGIVDLQKELIKFFFMGYKEPFIVTFYEIKNKGIDPNKDLYEAMANLSRKV